VLQSALGLTLDEINGLVKEQIVHVGVQPVGRPRTMSSYP